MKTPEEILRSSPDHDPLVLIRRAVQETALLILGVLFKPVTQEEQRQGKHSHVCLECEQKIYALFKDYI